jgi:hypothetical protein
MVSRTQPKINLGLPAPTIFSDSTELSAFGNLLVSQSIELFSSQQQYGDNTTDWETSLAGAGAISFLPNESTIQMSPGGTAAGSSATRQTRLYHRYLPGHGTRVRMSFCFDGGVDPIADAGNTRRIGYYDANDGVFLEAASGVVSFVLRSSTSGSPSDANRVAQADWSIDRFDGQGPSGITIDWSKAQNLFIDLQWLGVGRVRVGFMIGGTTYLAHVFDGGNVLTGVYMKTANLPNRLETINTGTSSRIFTMKHICTSVMTGGGASPNSGSEYCYNNGGAGTAVGASARIPIVSLRAKTTGPNGVRNTGQISLEQFDVAAVGANAIFWELIFNPALTGAAFAALDAAHSLADVDKTATAVSGGTVLDAGYLAAGAQSKNDTAQIVNIKDLILAYSGLLNNQDIMTIVCTAPAGATSAFANLQWLERI